MKTKLYNELANLDCSSGRLMYLIGSVLLFLIGFTTTAQPYFQRAYGMQGDDDAFDVVAASDDGYLLAIQNSNTTFILKTDSQGNSIWRKRYYTPGTEYLQKIIGIESVNDGYLVVMNTYDTLSFGGYSEINLLKLTPSGDIVWNKSFTADDPEADCAQAIGIAAASDGGIIITGYAWMIGYTWGGKCIIAKVDASGTVQWVKAYFVAGHQKGRSIVEKPNGHILLNGGAWGLTAAWPFILEADENGNALWSNRYHATDTLAQVDATGIFYDVQYTNDGGFITIGDFILIIKYDSIGNVLWTKNYNPNFQTIIPLADSTYLMAGGELLATLSPSGQLLGCKLYNNLSLSCIAETTDGFTLAGLCSVPGDDDACLIKVDSSGNNVCPHDSALFGVANDQLLFYYDASYSCSDAPIEYATVIRDFISVNVGVATHDLCVCIPPVANFEIAGNAQDVSLINTSLFADNCVWNYGDGTFETNFYPQTHHYSQPGFYTACLIVTNGCGSDTFCTDVQVLSGLPNIAKKHFEVFPNPVKDLLVVRSDISQHINVRLINILGETVLDSTLTPSATINIPTVPGGIYAVHFYDNYGLRETTKIIVE